MKVDREVDRGNFQTNFKLFHLIFYNSVAIRIHLKTSAKFRTSFGHNNYVHSDRFY